MEKKKRVPRKTKKAVKGLRAIKHPLGLIVRYAVIGRVTQLKHRLYWDLTYATRSIFEFPTNVLRFKDDQEFNKWLKGQISVTFERKRKKEG